jgi:hypothetical protein
VSPTFPACGPPIFPASGAKIRGALYILTSDWSVRDAIFALHDAPKAPPLLDTCCRDAAIFDFPYDKFNF